MMITTQRRPTTRAPAVGIDRGTFGAINGASIVYDGAVVTDARFRTNDPCIWSAGPAARFARRYRNKLSPGLCSAREAGAKLGASLLAALDPLAPETARCCCGASCCRACRCRAVMWRVLVALAPPHALLLRRRTTPSLPSPRRARRRRRSSAASTTRTSRSRARDALTMPPSPRTAGTEGSW